MLKWIKALNYTYFHHLKLHKKLMISYGLIVFIPIVVLYFISYTKVATILKDNLLYSATQSYEQTYSFASYKLYKMLRSSDLIHNDSMIHEVLTSSITNTSIVEQVDAMFLLQRYLTSYEDDQDIQRVRLYVPSEFIFSNEGVNFLNQENIASALWYEALENQDKKIIFAPSEYLTDTPNSDTLSIIRPIYQLDNFSIIEGYLRIDFSKKILLDIIEKSAPSLNSFTLILNVKGIPVLSSNDNLLKKYTLSSEILAGYMENTTQYSQHDIQNKSYYIQSRLIPNTDWSIISVLPYDEILSAINAQQRILIVALVIMLSFAVGLAYLISFYMTTRLDTLTDHMANIGDTQFILPQFEEDQDEIGVLAKSYNTMLNQIQKLLNEQYISGIKIKSAELKAIQAQINPHFLYNTLEMINWMAKKQEIDHILLVTKELSRFYKLSLNKGNDLITLRDEFSHLNAYITIQNLRFENRITYHSSLSPEVASFIVPKIILQPIIENAIMHGILENTHQEGILDVKAELINYSMESPREDFPSNEERGRLTSSALLQANSSSCLMESPREDFPSNEERVRITVTDNGVGMTEDKLRILFNAPLETLDELEENAGSHYGLFNIKERLELFYGDSATLIATSEVGKGTCIEILLPYLR
jgi:two-component system, sensor histidine kinase YesM